MSASTPVRAPTVASSAGPWTRGPTDPRLADGSVHVWRADLTRVGEHVAELLSAAERERAAGFASDRDGALWRRSRGVLRTLLGRYLHERASSIALGDGPHGKPELSADGARRPRLFFNLSHSSQLALYAFSASAPVGVDVQGAREQSQRSPDHVALARRAFGEAEARRMAEREPGSREGEFLRLWTRHEAELKRRGTGIGRCELPIGRCELPGAPERAAVAHAAAVDSEPARRGAPEIVELDVGSHAAAALAMSGPTDGLRLWEWA